MTANDPVVYVEHPYPARPGLTPLLPGGSKGVLHTIEGGTETLPDGSPGIIQRMRNKDASASQYLLDAVVANYVPNGYVPHFTVSPVLRVAVRHLPYGVGGYALADLPGGVTTNRSGVTVQVELVGHAAQLMDEYTDADWRWLGKLLRQIGTEAGVPWVWPFPFPSYPVPSYGPNNGIRMAGPEFVQFAGWCGHMHVPENDHGDPGNINQYQMNQPEESDMAGMVFGDVMFKVTGTQATYRLVFDASRGGFTKQHVTGPEYAVLDVAWRAAGNAGGYPVAEVDQTTFDAVPNFTPPVLPAPPPPFPHTVVGTMTGTVTGTVTGTMTGTLS